MRGILSFLLLLVIAFFVVGYFRGWYTTEAKKSSDGSVAHGSLDLNLDKIGSDVHKVENKVSHATSNLVGKEEHAKGTIVEVTAPNFTLRTDDGKQLPMEVTSSAKTELQKVRIGDHATVDYHEKDGKNLVSAIKTDRQ